jgi:hypothetical protein
MSTRRDLFEIWFSRTDGLYPGPKFQMAGDAEEYLIEHFDQAPFAIRAPDGQWSVVGAGAQATGTPPAPASDPRSRAPR